MTVTITKLYRLQIPFKGGSYEHHLAKRNTTDSVIMVIEDTNGIQGIGECCPRDYVTFETYESVIENVKELAPSIFLHFDESLASIPNALQFVPDTIPSVRCLFETALLTYFMRKKQKNGFEVLGLPQQKTLTYSAAFDSGEATTFEKMGQFYSALQFKSAKLKIHSDNEINKQRILRIRELLGNHTSIRLDGNEIWEWNKNHHEIEALVDLGIRCFEQLFHKKDNPSCAAFRKHFGDTIELIADESVTTLASAQFHATKEYFTGVNLKISKNGGYFRALEIAQLFQEQNKTVRLGCHVGETSLLSLWGILFATAFPNLKDQEGGFGTYILTEDPFQPSILFGTEGKIALTPQFIQNINPFEFRHPNEIQ
ncbi:enolase C-terminal domain-like protein [Flavobacterium sp. NRK F7]|uniref:enolase C-terminal domain-like protein n=1 Tax=Flavobacterium sp. NRK F7 TaxID=2954930 RepID=UPI002090E2DD|nr:enolase C-terminal domain-like protein [Flavobacterium sp. NRK F7]MCO6162659.1 hypothetical protein [Flavobacterium sp. NRK F7]